MMAQQGLCTAFKVQLLAGNFSLADTIKLALYAGADIGPGTAAYSTINEFSGAGYTAGGVTLVNPVVSQSGAGAVLTFDNAIWDALTGAVTGALVYNASRSDYAIAVLDFGAPRVLANRRLELVIPDGFIGIL